MAGGAEAGGAEWAAPVPALSPSRRRPPRRAAGVRAAARRIAVLPAELAPRRRQPGSVHGVREHVFVANRGTIKQDSRRPELRGPPASRRPPRGRGPRRPGSRAARPSCGSWRAGASSRRRSGASKSSGMYPAPRTTSRPAAARTNIRTRSRCWSRTVVTGRPAPSRWWSSTTRARRSSSTSARRSTRPCRLP